MHELKCDWQERDCLRVRRQETWSHLARIWRQDTPRRAAEKKNRDESIGLLAAWAGGSDEEMFSGAHLWEQMQAQRADAR